MEFGEKIRELREAKGITLRKFAIDCGVSATYQSKIERGDFKPPSAEVISRMASVLGLDSDVTALEAGKIPTWIKGVLYFKPEESVRALKKLVKTPPKMD